MKSELPQLESGAFIFENDSIKIQYGFEKNGSLRVGIENKLNDPIYVDWVKSAIVFQGKNLSYASNEIKLKATGSSYLFSDTNSNDIDGVITKDRTGNYIHPQSSSQATRHIPFEYMEIPIKKPFQKIGIGQGVGKNFKFDKDSINPISNYLYITYEEDSRSEVYKQTFWTSDLTETMQSYISMNQDQFAKSTSTSFGDSFLFLGGSAILVLVIATNTEERSQ